MTTEISTTSSSSDGDTKLNESSTPKDTTETLQQIKTEIKTEENETPSPTTDEKKEEAPSPPKSSSDTTTPIQPSNLPPPAHQYTNYPLKNIRTPHAHDVLCGRGGGTNNHAGNESFRDLVNERKRTYLNSSKREKPLVSRSIVEAVRNRKPPGRFLTKDDKTGLWNDIGDQKAREKTSQALREGAPVIRREIGMTATVVPAPSSHNRRASSGSISSSSVSNAQLNVGAASWGAPPNPAHPSLGKDVMHHHHATAATHHHPLYGHLNHNGLMDGPPPQGPSRPSPLKNGNRTLSDSLHSRPALNGRAVSVGELNSSGTPASFGGGEMSSAVPESVRHLLRRADSNAGGGQGGQSMGGSMRQRGGMHDQGGGGGQGNYSLLQGHQSQLMANASQMPYHHNPTVNVPPPYGNLSSIHALQSQPLPNNNNGTALPTATAPSSSLSSLRDDKLRRSSCPPPMSSSFPFQNRGGAGGAGGPGPSIQHPLYNVPSTHAALSHPPQDMTHPYGTHVMSSTLPNMAVAMRESCHPPPKEGLPTKEVALAEKDVPKEAVVPLKHFEKLPPAIQDKLSLMEHLVQDRDNNCDQENIEKINALFMDAGLLGIDLETMQSTLIRSRKNDNEEGLGLAELERKLQDMKHSGVYPKLDEVGFSKNHYYKNNKKRKLHSEEDESSSLPSSKSQKPEHESDNLKFQNAESEEEGEDNKLNCYGMKRDTCRSTILVLKAIDTTC